MKKKSPAKKIVVPRKLTIRQQKILSLLEGAKAALELVNRFSQIPGNAVVFFVDKQTIYEPLLSAISHIARHALVEVDIAVKKFTGQEE